MKKLSITEKKMKKLSIILIAILAFFSLVELAFGLTWQTAPIMGYDAVTLSETGVVTGHVTVITGETPTKDDGTFYYDEDGNKVLGPTIPHYSMSAAPPSGDNLYLIGDPSVTEFYIDPDTMVDYGTTSGSHLTDLDSKIRSGSGVNLTALENYNYDRKYSFLGNGVNGAYDVEYATGFFTGHNFVMLRSTLSQLWLEDIGDWVYTEKWTEISSGEFITASNAFSVSLISSSSLNPVPEPGTLFLLGSGIIGMCGFWRKKFLKK